LEGFKWGCYWVGGGFGGGGGDIVGDGEEEGWKKGVGGGGWVCACVEFAGVFLQGTSVGDSGVLGEDRAWRVWDCVSGGVE